MKDLKDFESLVALHVAGCPPLAMREAIREAIEAFCEKTHIWKVELPPLGTIQGIGDYDIPVELDQRVVTVLSVKFKDRPLSGVTTEELDAALPTWSASGAGSTPYMFRVFVDDGAQFIRLFPTPSQREPGALKMRVALKPASSAENFPGFLYEDWRRVIASGAVSRLTAVPGKEYTNPDVAVYHARLFQIGMGKAMARMATGGTQRGLRVRPRRFGR